MAEGHEPTQAEVAAYIGKMLGSLEDLAAESQLAMLAYLIGVAREEASARMRDGIRRTGHSGSGP